jgi:hypothetical protein
MAWFSFTGTNPNDPSHYTLAPTQPNCPGTTSLCAIQAANNGSDRPVLSDPLKTEINEALEKGQPTANVKMKD